MPATATRLRVLTTVRQRCCQCHHAAAAVLPAAPAAPQHQVVGPLGSPGRTEQQPAGDTKGHEFNPRGGAFLWPSRVCCMNSLAALSQLCAPLLLPQPYWHLSGDLFSCTLTATDAPNVCCTRSLTSSVFKITLRALLTYPKASETST